EQPGELGVLGHVALAKERAALGIEPSGEQDGGGVVAALAQLRGIERDRDGVQVDDAEDALAALLACDVLDDRADVVAEVLPPRRLDPREDPHRLCPAGCSCAAAWSCPAGCSRKTGCLAAATSSSRRTGV